MKRKNSLFHLYGLIIFIWVGYAILIFIGSNFIAIPQILILITISFLIFFSQWSNTVQVNFSADHLVVKHFFIPQFKRYEYNNITSVEYVFTRIYGCRLIFKCTDNQNKKTEFTIYNPDKELLEFARLNIKTFKNKAA
jgi:hypothetical protein